MKRYLAILVDTLLSEGSYFLVHGNLNKKFITLPKKFKGFILVKDLSNKERHFAVGKYKSYKDGRFVVIKIWKGDFKNFHYFSLRHQVECTKVISEVINNSVKLKKGSVSIPKFIDSSITNHEVVLITEYIDGLNLDRVEMDQNVEWELYKRCVNFFRSCGAKCTDEQRKIITTKTILDYLILYPFILVIAIKKHPDKLLTIMSGVPVFLKGSVALIFKKPTTLVHGDLHMGNIIDTGKKLFILDIEQSRFSYPEYESVTTLCTKRFSTGFKKRLIRSMISTKTTRSGLGTLLVNASTHNLTDKPNQVSVSNYLKVLDLGLNVNKMYQYVS